MQDFDRPDSNPIGLVIWTVSNFCGIFVMVVVVEVPPLPFVWFRMGCRGSHQREIPHDELLGLDLEGGRGLECDFCIKVEGSD